MIDRRWVLTALVMVTMLVTALVAAVVFNSPTVEIAVGRAGIITAAAAGPIGVLMLMLQVGDMKQQVGDVQDKVNGHLEAHMGHTDQQVQALVDARLRELAQSQTSVAPPVAPPPQGAG